MTTRNKGLILALLQIAIVLSLGGKLLYDRAHCSRVWVRTGSIDPELPIRGRYVTLNLEVHVPNAPAPPSRTNPNAYAWQPVELSVQSGRLVATESSRQTGIEIVTWNRRPIGSDSDVYFLSPQVAFFLPEHAEVPRIRANQELWAEVTIPKKGPPRPIQLAMKIGSSWIPLTYR
jgi:hypothetical protein